MSDLYVIGAGGHGAVVAEIAEAMGHIVIGFIDDDSVLAGTNVLGKRVLGGRGVLPANARVALGIGNNTRRAELTEDVRSRNYKIMTLIHPSAVVSPSAKLGEGTVVMAQAVVNARTVTGRGCILNTSCSLDHDCTLGDFVHICPGVNLAGAVSIGDRSFLGIGTCVRQVLKIGSDCILGAGSVIVDDLPASVTVYGNPVKVKKK